MRLLDIHLAATALPETGYPRPIPPGDYGGFGIVNVIDGTDGDDTLQGFDSPDFGNIYAKGGNDLVRGGTAGEVIDGDSGNDSLFGGAGNDLIDGGPGDDRIGGGSGRDIAFYNFGDASAAVVFDALPINSDTAATIADGLGGFDQVSGIEAVYIGGSVFDDSIRGSAGNDVIYALQPGTGQGDGNDTVSGAGGNDYISGGLGDDSLRGGADNDSLRGSLGDDVLHGGSGYDAAVFVLGLGSTSGASASAATIGTGFHLTVEDGLGGVDELFGIECAVLEGSAFDDTFTGSTGHDDLKGNGGADQLYGGAGRDSVWGGEGDDVLQGEAGHDSMRGEFGNDRLSGGTGFDWLDGGYGNDTLSGGDGIDAFSFSTLLAVQSADSIVDFRSGTDMLQFSAAVFGTLGAEGNLARSAFVRGNAAQDGDDRLVYDRAAGQLFYDADGSGAGAAVLVAELPAGTVLAAADIWVV